MTVIEAIKRGAEFLEKKRVESPRLQVELLLAHILDLPRMKLYLNFDRALSEGELERSRELIRRRALREPLQHIIGSTCFCGIELEVSKQALIPRPETEMLAEAGWKYLNTLRVTAGALEISTPDPSSPHEPEERTDPPQEPQAEGPLTPALSPSEGAREERPTQGFRPLKTPLPVENSEPHFCKEMPAAAAGIGPLVLDFGTGSGCLAIAIAVKCPAARCVAVDISPAALELARRNAARHQVDSRIEFILSDGFAGVPAGTRFDLVVANPPYIPSEIIPTLEPEVRDFDPRSALDGGADGLEFYRRLAVEAGGFMKTGGLMLLELGDDQAVSVEKLFADQMWVVESIKPDYNGRLRALFARWGQ